MKIIISVCISLFSVLFVFSQEDSSLLIERTYTPNSRIFIDSTLNRVITIAKVSSNKEINKDYTLKEDENLQDVLPDVNFNGNGKDYFILSVYVYKKDTGDIIRNEIENTILLSSSSFLENKDYEEIVFKNTTEEFNQCNNGLDDIVNTNLLASLGNYGIVKRNYKTKQTLELIFVDCSYVSTLDIKPDNIGYYISPSNENRLFLCNDKELMIVSISYKSKD